MQMSMEVLRNEVRQIAWAWGFEPEAVDVVLLSERLLGAGGGAVDDSGVMHITYQEFIQFLETQDPKTRVAYASE